jgi:hypothetical protein
MTQSVVAQSLEPGAHDRSAPSYFKPRFSVPFKYRRTRLAAVRCASDGLAQNFDKTPTAYAISGRVATAR